MKREISFFELLRFSYELWKEKEEKECVSIKFIEWTGLHSTSYYRILKNGIGSLSAENFLKVINKCVSLSPESFKFKALCASEKSFDISPSDTVGTFLRRMRKESGCSQTFLASECGMEQKSISFLETGRMGTSVKKMMLIAKKCGYDFGIFFEE